MRGDHSAKACGDWIADGKVDAIFIADMGDGKASQTMRACFASAFFSVKAQAQLDKTGNVIECGAPYYRPAHVASRFCERSTARSALIAFAASAGVGSSEKLAIASP